MEHRFQVDLRGIIEILSEHLYSGPQVFLRELLQNAVDAITARQKLETDFTPEVRLELTKAEDGVPVLIFSDNGVGLLEVEVHQFLATIGKSSKRVVGSTGGNTSDFIGQFGIGLLSCFVLSDEIVMLTKSAKGGEVTEFRGSPEGNYSVQTLPDALLTVGSRVTLRAKAGFEQFFVPDEVAKLAKYYGGLLPYPIFLKTPLETTQINAGGAVWRREFETTEERQNALLEFGRMVLGRDPFDVVDIKTKAGGIDGVALVVPWTPSLASKTKHLVYLKNMLLADDAQDVAPEWAFFVKLVVNSNSLKPMASREGFAEDASLEAARIEIGELLQAYLSNLSVQNPEKFKQLLHLHDLSLRALALENTDLFHMFIPHLEFETSSGSMTLPAYREKLQAVQGGVVHYTTSIEQFNQMARVAGAQGFNIINGGYVYAANLLERFAQVTSGVQVERIEADFFADRFEELSISERNNSFEFLRVLKAQLEPNNCGVELLHFKPADLPTLFVTSAQQRYVRSLETAQEVASDLFSGVLENLKTVGGTTKASSTLGASKASSTLGASKTSSMRGQMYFNMSNSLVRRLAALGDTPQSKRVVDVLYIQALLLGHHPLSSHELKTLTNGLSALIEFGLQVSEVSRAVN